MVSMVSISWNTEELENQVPEVRHKCILHKTPKRAMSEPRGGLFGIGWASPLVPPDRRCVRPRYNRRRQGRRSQEVTQRGFVKSNEPRPYPAVRERWAQSPTELDTEIHPPVSRWSQYRDSPPDSHRTGYAREKPHEMGYLGSYDVYDAVENKTIRSCSRY